MHECGRAFLRNSLRPIRPASLHVMSDSPPAVQLEGIAKAFGTCVANDGVTLNVEQGSIHALVGENGAGKTTLMSVLYGLYQPDAGTIGLDGRGGAHPLARPTRCARARHGAPALHAGRAAHRGRERHARARAARGPFLDTTRAVAEVRALSERYGLPVDPEARVENLSVGEQQRVEILKALYHGARVLILDEPTAVLTPQEVDDLFRVLRALQAQGTTIVLITHKLREVIELADRVTVMRDGTPSAAADRRARRSPSWPS